ncbi:MAG: PilZ domain-containing protein [Nitrospiraceae bacterium]|nr:MAG: PilZ domain-containing protein [Nitrospiraceae bacterium]
MEARRHKRKIVSYPAELIMEDKRYACTIENLSENGIYAVTAPQRSSEFTVGAPIEVRFQPPSGEKQALPCRIKWSYLTPPHGFTSSIGMEIIAPPLKYTKLLESVE